MTKNRKLFVCAILCCVSFQKTSCTKSNARSTNQNATTSEPPSVQPPLHPPDEDTTTPEGYPIPEVVVAPITESEGAVLEKRNTPSLQKLTFETSAHMEEGRYLSEYMLMIQAHETSCLQLKITSHEASDIPPSDPSKEPPCEAGPLQKDASTVTHTAPLAAPSADTIQTLFLSHQPISHDAHLQLTTQELCSERIFRIKSDSSSHGQVSTKSAFLVALSDHVRVWLDREVGHPCLSGTPTGLNHIRLALASTYRSTYPEGYLGTLDRFTLAHYEQLASETESIYTQITQAWGKTSDVDNNGVIDLVITPEINRSYFKNMQVGHHDLFRAKPIYTPEDLMAFHPVYNPSSNEGETIYAWAPDPGGLYQKNLYPTSNSISSNYLKGYLAFQIAQLIITYARSIALKHASPEETWLSDSLAFLTSSYAAGNDYTVDFLSEYLNYRHPYISLTQPLSQNTLPKGWQYNAEEAQWGMRTLFGWYLHSRLCGTDVKPCAVMQKFIQTDLIGTKNIENILNEPFTETLKNFSESVGVYFTDEPKISKSRIEAINNHASLVEFPTLQEIRTDSTPQTVEQNATATIQLTGDDKTLAGPFPSLQAMPYQAMPYQTMYPDSDITLNMSKHSVTYILVTGLVDPETHMSLYQDSHVGVSILPLGNRDPEKRRSYFEKISAQAHMDLRPINLTSSTDAFRTYYATPDKTEDYTVTPQREVRIYGSIERFDIQDTTGSTHTMGDTDAFNVSVDVCAGDHQEDTCRAGDPKQVIIQVIPRESSSELDPALILTTNSLAPFRGRMALGKLSSVKQLTPYEEHYLSEDPHRFLLTCLSEATYQTATNYLNYKYCSNSGVLKSTWNTDVCTQIGTYAAHKACGSGFPQQSVTFDAFSYALGSYQGPAIDNYFYAGLGFPFLNQNRIHYKSMQTSDGTIFRNGHLRAFLSEEKQRQFFDWTYTQDLKPFVYTFTPLWHGTTPGYGTGDDFYMGSHYVHLAPEKVYAVTQLRSWLEAGSSFALTDAFAHVCESLDMESFLCASPIAQYSLFESSIKQILSRARIYCPMTDGSFNSSSDMERLCGAIKSTKTALITGTLVTMGAWLDSRQIVFGLEPYEDPISLISYYPIVIPEHASEQTYCSGLSANPTDGPLGSPSCPIEDTSKQFSDIRNQLNVPHTQITHQCASKTYMDDFHICLDPLNFQENALDTHLQNHQSSIFLKYSSPIERVRSFDLPIAKQSGEIIGKAHQMPYLIFKLKPDQAYPVHFMVGGLHDTSGKYVVRIRALDHTPILPEL